MATKWLQWYELTNEQKLQARELDADVRNHPSLYEYQVNGAGKVTDYSRIEFD